MNYRFLLLLVPALTLFLTACSDDDDQYQFDQCTTEYITIEEFAAADTLMYDTLENTGLLYYIADSGSVEKPNANSDVIANYVGYFTDGQAFDGTTNATGPASFNLQQVIDGWMLGVPLIGKEGRIRLLIPSELAYGSQGARDQSGNYVICPDTDLVFNIQLVDFAD